MHAAVVGNDGTSVQIELSIVHLTTSQIYVACLKKFSVFLGLAVVTAFVPILHFVLVPGFLLAGLFLSVRSFLKDRTIIESTSFSCPSCQGELTLEKTLAHFPIKETCIHCRKQLKIRPE